MSVPIFYDYQNAAVSQVNPSTMHAKDTRLTYFYARYLLQKAISVFKWKFPEEWIVDMCYYFLYSIYGIGYVSVINTDKFGVIPQICTLNGYGVCYQPTRAAISNNLLRGYKDLTIGEQCSIIRLQPDYGGILDLVYKYANMMAWASEAITVNLINSKLSYVFTAGDKTIAESFKKMFDSIASGDPAVVIDKKMLNDDGSPAWHAFQQNLGQSYIVDRILSDLRKIEAMYDTEIGIPNANTDKRERLITDEVNANNVETATRADMWLQLLQRSCKETRDMFGIDLDVDWRVNPYGGDKDESENISSGSIRMG